MSEKKFNEPSRRGLLEGAMIALGAVLWFWGIRYLDEDTANAEASATASGTAT